MDNKQKKRTQLSVIIRDPVEKLNRAGINCVKYESNASQSMDRLFTAGRDSIIRVYTNLVPNYSASANSTSSATTTHSDSDIDKYYQMSLSHHTDWINDIVLCNKTKTIFSASSDTTVKVWNSSKGTLLNTMNLHKDYVKCLSYAKDKQLLASGGLDKNIFIWDISNGVALNPSGLDLKTINDNKYSIYSLAMNDHGTALACGSPENCIRLWDPRTCSKIMKLKGHTHNIRHLLLNKDGTQLLSASSDHTIRLWSLGQQRCISTMEIHTEGVWTLCVNDTFTKVYSGGKDNRVYATDLRNSDDSVLIAEESAPILSIDFGHEQESLWISTTNSSVKNWSLKPINNNNEHNNKKTLHATNPAENSNRHSATLILPNSGNIKADSSNLATKSSSTSSSFSMSSSFLMQTPLNTHPCITLRGTSSIKQYTILNDKRYIVTKDTEENVCVWDVLQARKLEALGKENYENAIKVRQRFISVPNWFTVDLKLGVLTINLDENEWQSAWINFKDMDSNHVRQTQYIDLSEAKVNYGYIFLESLFKNCSFLNPQKLETCTNVIISNPKSSATTSTNNASMSTDDNGLKNEENEEENVAAGLLRFNIPDHTTLIISEVAGRTLYRLEVRDLAREIEQGLFANVIPIWVVDALLGKTNPKFNRVNFLLYPYNQTQNKVVNKDRFSSFDVLQVKKLKEHVYVKILNMSQSSQIQNDTNNNTNNFGNGPTSNSISQQKSNSLMSSEKTANQILEIANKTIELICSDQILSDPDMNLRTIKHLIWKGNGDVLILYRMKNGAQ